LPDFADLASMARGVQRENDQILLAGDRAKNGMRRCVGAEIQFAMLDIVGRAGAGLAESLEGGGERGELACWVRPFGSCEFSCAIGGAAEEELLAAAIAGGLSANEVGGQEGEQAVLDKGHVLDAIKDGPAVRRGADFRLLIGEAGRGSEERVARFRQQLQDLIAIRCVHRIQPASALRSFSKVVERSSGSTRVSPTTVMKFASPAQRGST
jgi:hypothetical protein